MAIYLYLWQFSNGNTGHNIPLELRVSDSWGIGITATNQKCKNVVVNVTSYINIVLSSLNNSKKSVGLLTPECLIYPPIQISVIKSNLIKLRLNLKSL